MQKIALVIVCSFMLAGCQKTVSELSYSELKDLADEISERCKAQGANRGSPEFNACFDVEAKREIASRENSRIRVQIAGAALAGGIANAGRVMATPQPIYSPTRSITCQSTRDGFGNTTTRCN